MTSYLPYYLCNSIYIEKILHNCLLIPPPFFAPPDDGDRPDGDDVCQDQQQEGIFGKDSLPRMVLVEHVTKNLQCVSKETVQGLCKVTDGQLYKCPTTLNNLIVLTKLNSPLAEVG